MKSTNIHEKFTWLSILVSIKAEKRILFQLLLSMILGTSVYLALPYLTQSLIDIGVQYKDNTFIKLILFAQFTLFLASAWIEFMRSRILLYLGSKVSLSILITFWSKVVKLPIDFINSKTSGDFIQRLIDQRRIEQFLTGNSFFTLFSLLNLTVYLAILYNYDSLIFKIFICFAFLYTFWSFIFHKAKEKIDQRQFAMGSKINTQTIELINGISEIKQFHAEEQKMNEWLDTQKDIFTIQLKNLSVSQYQQAGAHFLTHGKDVIISFVVANSVIDGTMTLGSMVAVLTILGMLNSPLENLIIFIQTAQNAKISLNRLNEIQCVQSEDEHDANKYDFASHELDSEIKIKNLNFAYSNQLKKKALAQINLTIPRRGVTAIVGPSGSGKTTLLKILQKTIDNYEGEILIGDTLLKNISHQSWRAHTSSASHNGYIFTDTIRKNVALGQNDQDNCLRVKQICALTNALEFIQSLPLGFETILQTDGVGLSQGQKQRILLARALFKKGQIYFFDEATNALDTENEKTILENIRKYLSTKTVVLISHRLATIRTCDKIIVLNNGSVEEVGSHGQLMSNKGLYYDLYTNQDDSVVK